LLRPGGAGGPRRKHRPGQAETHTGSFASAERGGRPWPPPLPRRNHRLGSERTARTPGPGHLFDDPRPVFQSSPPPVTEELPFRLFFLLILPFSRFILFPLRTNIKQGFQKGFPCNHSWSIGLPVSMDFPGNSGDRSDLGNFWGNLVGRTEVRII
jgi:hypothetical protein